MNSPCLLLLLCILLNACASVPNDNGKRLDTDLPLQSVREEQGRQISQYAEPEKLNTIQSFVLPNAVLKLDSAQTEISAEQLAILSNALNRSLCRELSPHLLALPEPSTDALEIEVALTGITSTSKAVSGLSAAVDVFVPGPFRIPAGMGAIALDARAFSNNQTLAFMRWAKGANPVLNSAKVSSIGDAYDLLDTFAREFAELLLQKNQTGTLRAKLPESQRSENEQLCLNRYGKVPVIGKGAAFLLPLSPEFIDQGKPEAIEPSTETK